MKMVRPGQDRAPEGKTMKLIEKNQLIGTGDGFMHYRDLYEKEDGARVSVRTSKHLEVA